MAGRGRTEAFPALSVGKQGTGTGSCEDPVSDVTVPPDFLSFRERYSPLVPRALQRSNLLPSFVAQAGALPSLTEL